MLAQQAQHTPISLVWLCCMAVSNTCCINADASCPALTNINAYLPAQCTSLCSPACMLNAKSHLCLPHCRMHDHRPDLALVQAGRPADQLLKVYWEELSVSQLRITFSFSPLNLGACHTCCRLHSATVAVHVSLLLFAELRLD